MNQVGSYYRVTFVPYYYIMKYRDGVQINEYSLLRKVYRVNNR